MRGCKGLQSLLGCHFFRNVKIFGFFDIMGGMCSSLICQSFKTQLNLLSAKLLLSSLFWGFRALSYLKIHIPYQKVSLQFHLTLHIMIQEYQEISEFGPSKLFFVNLFKPLLLQSEFHVNIYDLQRLGAKSLTGRSSNWVL